MQERLALFARFATVVTLVFGLLGGGVMAATHASRGGWQWRATLTQMSGALVYGGIWALARHARELSSRTLGLLDFALSFVTALAFAGMGWQMPVASRPELTIAFGMSLALVSRAVFIPSTPCARPSSAACVRCLQWRTPTCSTRAMRPRWACPARWRTRITRGC